MSTCVVPACNGVCGVLKSIHTAQPTIKVQKVMTHIKQAFKKYKKSEAYTEEMLSNKKCPL